MRILVTAPTDSSTIDEIMWFCQAHGMDFCSGHYVVYDGEYRLWRIYCQPSKYVDMLLLKYSNHLVVY